MNVVVFRQDNNGDVLLTGPAIRAIAADVAHLTLVCGPSGAAAARALPGVDAVIVAEAAWIEATPALPRRRELDAFVDTLAAGGFARAIVFTSFHQSPLPAALLARMAGIPFVGAISVDYPGALLDVRHRVDDDIHEVERALSLAAALGYRLPPNDAGHLAMRYADVNPLPPGDYVVVHPGATVPARAWNPLANRELVARLAARGTRVVVTGGAAERDLCAFVAGDGGTSIAGETNFAELGRVVADARAIVVGNTGAAHVAAAVGTPVVSLFAPTIPNVRFHPWQVPHVTLGVQDIACRGCRARTCPLPVQACLDAVGVDDVLAALDALAERAVA